MAVAGKLEVQMFANIARITEDMTKARGVVGSAMASVTSAVNMAKNALGALGVGLSIGWAVGFIKNSIDATARMKDLGQEAGVTASQISRFEAPARMAGLGLDAVASAMFRMNKAAMEAKDPQTASAQALRAIGLSAAELKGLKPDEMFEKIARAADKYAIGNERNAVMQQVFSKSGKEMNRVIAEIADAHKLVATATDEEAEAADRLGDQLVELQMNSERAWRSIIAEGVPAMNEIIKVFIEGKKQGGFFAGLFQGGMAGASIAFDKLVTQSPAEKLAAINLEAATFLQSQRDLDKVWASMGMRINPQGQAAQDKTWAEIQARKLAIESEISKLDIAAQDKRATAPGDPSKPVIKFDPAASLAAAAGLKTYENEVVALEKELAHLNGTGEMAAYILELQGDKFKNVTADAKINLEILKERNIERKSALVLINQEIADEQRMIQGWQSMKDAADQLIGSQVETNRQTALENSLIGQTANATELALVAEQNRKNIMKAMTVEQRLLITEQGKHLMGLTAEKQILADQQNRWVNLTSAASQYFGAIGAGVGKLITTMVELGKTEESIAKQRIAIANDPTLDPEKKAQLQLTLMREETQQRLGAYGDMADAASNFFDKQSRGYKALQAVSQVFHAAELAMTIAELVPKAIGAVLNQGNGDPYTAFGRMAAMAAIVAGLGVAIGGGSSSGGGMSAKDRQAAAGTGSILGNAKAQSESISKALQLLSNTSILGNEHTASMMRSLRNIDNNIGGLAAIVVRSGQLTGTDETGYNLATTNNANANSFGGPNPLGLPSLFNDQKFFNMVFGTTKRSIVDSGLQINAQTLGQARSGISADAYADIESKKSSLFGLIKSSRIDPSTQALSAEITSQFTMIINGLFDSIMQAAKVFGSNEGAIGQILDAFKIDFQKISFKDLTGDEIEKQLRAIFSKIGDDMAGAAFAGLDRFQKVGEGLFETLMRLAQEFTATDMVARILGKDVKTAFGEIGFASMGARTELVKLFGGIEEMSDSVTKFYDQFYTAAEKNGFAVDTLTQQLDALGFSVPANATAFRDLVTAQDLSTESGRKAFAALTQLGPAFKQIADYAKQFDDAKATVGTTIAQAIRDLTFGTLDSSGQYKMLQTEAQALKDSLGGMTDAGLIASTVSQIVGLSNQAFGMLDAGEQKAKLDEFVLGLKATQLEADTRLSELQKEAADHAAQMLAEQKAIAETERATAEMNRETALIERDTANLNAGTARQGFRVEVVGGGGESGA